MKKGAENNVLQEVPVIIEINESEAPVEESIRQSPQLEPVSDTKQQEPVITIITTSQEIQKNLESIISQKVVVNEPVNRQPVSVPPQVRLTWLQRKKLALEQKKERARKERIRLNAFTMLEQGDKEQPPVTNEKTDREIAEMFFSSDLMSQEQQSNTLNPKLQQAAESKDEETIHLQVRNLAEKYLEDEIKYMPAEVMFKSKSFLFNIEKIYALRNRIKTFRDTMAKFPENYENLPPEWLERLEARREMDQAFIDAVNCKMSLLGFNAETGKVHAGYQNKKKLRSDAAGSLSPLMKQFREGMENYKITTERIKGERLKLMQEGVSQEIIESIFNPIKEQDEKEDNALSDNKELSEKAKRLGNDGRALKIFAPSYIKGGNVTEKDMKNKEKARLYYEAFASGNKRRIEPHLERMLREFLAIMPSPEMISDEYIQKNAAKLKQWSSKNCYFENVMLSHKWFFDGLPPETLQNLKLRSKLNTAFSGALIWKLDMMGIDHNYANVREKGDLMQGRDNAAFYITKSMKIFNELSNKHYEEIKNNPPSTKRKRIGAGKSVSYSYRYYTDLEKLNMHIPHQEEQPRVRRRISDEQAKRPLIKEALKEEAIKKQREQPPVIRTEPKWLKKIMTTEDRQNYLRMKGELSEILSKHIGIKDVYVSSSTLWDAVKAADRYRCVNSEKLGAKKQSSRDELIKEDAALLEDALEKLRSAEELLEFERKDNEDDVIVALRKTIYFFKKYNGGTLDSNL
jgi:hypothetical protein